MEQYPHPQPPMPPQAPFRGQPVSPPYAYQPQPMQPYGQLVEPQLYGQPVYRYQMPVYQAVYVPQFALRPPEDPRRKGAGRTFNIMCLVVLLQTAIAILVETPLVASMTMLGINVYSGEALQWLSMLMVPVSTALPFFIYMLVSKKSAAEYLRFEKNGFFTALLCVLAGTSLALLANYPSGFVQNIFFHFGYEPNDVAGGGESSWYLFALEMFCTAVLVPVMEEFAFRGVLLSSLRKYGSGFAIFASALVFSLVHLDFPTVIFAFIAGLVFGFLYDRTHNLWITIGIHALNNGFAVISNGYAEFLFGEKYADLVSNAIFGGLILVGLLALLILILWKRKFFFFGRNRENQGEFNTRSNGELLPLSASESLGVTVRSPLFWVIFSLMVFYTAALFF